VRQRGQYISADSFAIDREFEIVSYLDECVESYTGLRYSVLSMIKFAFIVCATAILSAQEPSPELIAAKALDREISGLKKLSDGERAGAIKKLASRIRQQPKEFAVALAANLAVDGVDGSGDDTLLDIANTLAESLRMSPGKSDEPAYLTLAELVRYNNLPVSLDDPNYTEAIEKLAANEKHRADLDFALFDLQGKRWSLKRLRGKVVIVNFWATWCPPCRAELPELADLHKRFAAQGLVILAISDEDPSTVRRFAGEYSMNYPVLIDTGGAIKGQFRVSGLPQTFVYNRQGRLVAHAPARPSRQSFLKMLGRTELRF
jgi:peroxiredoxin